jgi:hypothetical protein
MNRIVEINKEQYDSLVQVEELLTSNIYATGNDYTDESILEDVSAILEAYDKKEPEEMGNNKQPNYSVQLRSISCIDFETSTQTLEQFHYRGFKVRYLGATNHKGARVVIEDTRHGDKRIISYDYSQRSIKEIAYNFLIDLGIELDGFTYNEKDGSYTLLTTDFSTKIKA